MNKLLRVRELAPNVKEYVFDAPEVVRNAQPGQFVIVITDEEGERVPFTICDMDKDKGELVLLIQTVGYSTKKLAKMKQGDSVFAIAGPLGNSTDLDEFENVMLVGGGIGNAVIFPQAKKRMQEGKPCEIIVGARNEGLLVYIDEFTKNCKKLHVVTDDGSSGEQGFVTTKLKQLLDAGQKFDCVFTVGPMMMMKAVCDLTRQYNVKTIISMNSIMVDGTGMCGCCRVDVDGEIKYACIDGPEFDGHSVDFVSAMNRSGFYKEHESKCNLRD